VKNLSSNSSLVVNSSNSTLQNFCSQKSYR